MILRIIVSTIILTFSICLNASNNIFNQPPFERAVCCIKFYEGMHREKDYPYVGYGHRLNPGENYKPNMSFAEAELLLRKDLKEFCKMFRKYGKDSLLLATIQPCICHYAKKGITYILHT